MMDVCPRVEMELVTLQKSAPPKVEQMTQHVQMDMEFVVFVC